MWQALNSEVLIYLIWVWWYRLALYRYDFWCKLTFYSSKHKTYVIAVKFCYGNWLQCDDIVFAELTINRLTVGKIYAGLLIAENWKAYRASKVMLKRNRGNENENALAKANSVSLISVAQTILNVFLSFHDVTSFCTLRWYQGNQADEIIVAISRNQCSLFRSQYIYGNKFVFCFDRNQCYFQIWWG